MAVETGETGFSKPRFLHLTVREHRELKAMQGEQSRHGFFGTRNLYGIISNRLIRHLHCQSLKVTAE